MAGEYRPSAPRYGGVILIICSNLAVLIVIFEATAKQALVFPNSTNARTLAAIL
jgi:hypothetical protein